ncbi:TcC31.29 [Trypanosoma grayi]|uniref:TcC31.29 n=1 Tax=Trypanosoma grayi TaxID=71804 RepID=UPI0004F44E49|nr:TcC31.29 [Trypanosoma grayi]KEG06987.1 TcC31.29 [Trypanosoma grayi]
MLRLTRVVQCALTASSSSALFASTRSSGGSNKSGGGGGGSGVISGGGGDNRRGGKKGLTSSARASSKRRGGNGAALDFDLASFGVEGDGSDGGLLLPPQGGLQVSPSRHQERLPQYLRPPLPPSLLLERVAVEDAVEQHVETPPKRRKNKRKMNNKHTADEDEAAAMAGEEVEEDNAGRGIWAVDSPQNNGHAAFPDDDTSNTTSSSSSSSSNNSSAPSNPFRGLHEHITRSYRLDQVLAVTRPVDMLVGRQESKSGAFSFIRFECGPQFLEDNRNSTATGASLGSAHNDSALVVAERLLDFPPHMRHFHSICGRENVPCDFFADVDLPNETPAVGEKVLLEMLNYLEVRLHGIGFLEPSFLVLTNEVPSADKVSYHVHARAMGTPGEDHEETGGSGDDGVDSDTTSMDKPTQQRQKKKKEADGKKSGKRGRRSAQKIVAFQDYRVVKLLADEVNMTLGRTVVDEQCYRVNGMLRCAYSSKLAAHSAVAAAAAAGGGGAASQKGKRLVPLLKAQDAALQRRLNDMAAQIGVLSEAEILERTFGVRFAPVADTRRGSSSSSSGGSDTLRHFRLIRAKHVLGPRDAQAAEFDAYGNPVSVYLTEGAKWRRFKSVIQKLRRMPPRSAESYDLWVRVGLALHNFSNEDHVFEEWVRFSLKCPQKYSRETCRKKWQQFERNPDALNWRRGFNYLNSTVWRSVQGE